MDILTSPYPKVIACDYYGSGVCDVYGIRTELLALQGLQGEMFLGREYPLDIKFNWRFRKYGLSYNGADYHWNSNVWCVLSLSLPGGPAFTPASNWERFYDAEKNEVLCPGIFTFQGDLKEAIEGEEWFEAAIDPSLMGLPIGQYEYQINLETWGEYVIRDGSGEIKGRLYGELVAPPLFSGMIEIKEGLPIAGFTYSPALPQPAGTSISFINTSQNPLFPEPLTSWWDFRDGYTSSDAQPVHAFQDDGVYDVELTVTNSAGSDSYATTVTVLQRPPIPVFVRQDCAILPDSLVYGTEQFSPYFRINNQGGPGDIWIIARVRGVPGAPESVIFISEYIEEGINELEGMEHSIDWYLGYLPGSAQLCTIAFETNAVGLYDVHSSWDAEIVYSPSIPVCGDYTNQLACEAGGCYWYDGSCHSSPPPQPCSYWATKTACEAAGCYWYDGSCHSKPEPTDDKSWINTAMIALAGAGIMLVSWPSKKGRK